MAKKKVIILGGGFGGLSAAQQFDRHIQNGNDANLDVILLDRGGSKYIGATHQFVLTGRKTREEVEDIFSADSPKLESVKVVLAEVKKLELQAKKVRTDQGDFDFDDLIISLGVEFDLDAVPGLKEASYNICSIDDILSFKKAIADFDGGTIVVGAARVPYKCPPVPHEMAFVVHDLLEKKGIREKTKLLFTTPFETAVPKANPKPMQSMMDRCRIPCSYQWPMKNIDPENKSILYMNNESIKYDLLLCTYPQRAIQLLRDIPDLCNQDGWIPVNGRTHRTKFEGVYAIGDNCANIVAFPDGRKEGHPKAGGFAEMQGEYVADVIVADELASNEDWLKPTLEMTKGNKCVVEGHGDRGIWVEVDFFSNPNKPKFVVSEPAAELVEDKMQWVEEHRTRWFK